MNIIDKVTAMNFHRHRINKYSSGTVEALGWKNRESQSKRFEILAGVGDMNGSSVLDLGCGYGDLRAYLDTLFIDLTYVGVDYMPEFIAEARERYNGREDTIFFKSDFTKEALPLSDYVIANGVFCYRSADKGFHFELIAKMYGAARLVLAFNMLDKLTFPEDELLLGHDRDEVVDFCRKLSPVVEVRSGYIENDFTVLLYRE
ncbi:MAG: class I SAM-dependent methyltransferase [Thermodesulfobacteriota bacterium]